MGGIKPKGYLILDMSGKNIFALIADRNGNTFPCVFETSGITSRYFFSDIALDADKYQSQQVDDTFLANLNKVIFESQSDLSFSDTVGWFRPYDVPSDKEMILINPLYTLLSKGIMEKKSEELFIGFFSSAFLVFLLQPIIHSIRKYGFQPHELNVIAVVPAYLNRMARIILRSILKRRLGFGKGHVMLIAPAAALGMHFLRFPYSQKVSALNVEDDCLHIGKVNIEYEDRQVCVVCEETHSVRQLGRNAVIKLIAGILAESGLLPASDRLSDDLNRALSGLFGGIFSTRIPAEPPLQITYGLLNKKIQESDREITDAISAELKPVIKDFEDGNSLVAARGSYFMIGQLEKLILNIIGKRQPYDVGQILAIERVAYGVAYMLNWRDTNQSRKVMIRNNYSVRVPTQQDNTIELIPHHFFSIKEGERRTIRQVLGVQAEANIERDVLAVDILWGNNPNRKYNMNLCTLTWDIGADHIRNNSKLELAFELIGISDGVRGELKATFQGYPPKGYRTDKPIKLRFPGLSNVIPGEYDYS